MKRHLYLFLAFLLAAHVTGCATTPPTDARHNATILPPPVGLDTTYTNPREIPQKAPIGVPQPGFFARINPFHKQETTSASGSEPTQNATQLPRKCKGCQFVTVIGNDNNVKQASASGRGNATPADSGAVVTNTSIGKNKASAATAPGATATTTVEKPGFPWWIVVVGAGVGVWVFRKSIPFIG